MKLRGSKTVYEDFDVSERDIREAYLTIFCRQNNWRHDYFIKDGKVFFEEDCYTSHRWSQDQFVRDATEEDVKVFNHVRAVIDMWKEGK